MPHAIDNKTSASPLPVRDAIAAVFALVARCSNPEISSTLVAFLSACIEPDFVCSPYEVSLMEVSAKSAALDLLTAVFFEQPSDDVRAAAYAAIIRHSLSVPLK